MLPTPVLLGCSAAGFEFVDHDGNVRLRLSATELVAISSFRRLGSVARAWDDVAASEGELMAHDAFLDLVRRSVVGGLVVTFDPDDPSLASDTRQAERMRANLTRLGRVHAEFDRLEAEHDQTSGRVGNTRVIGFHTNWASPPSSLGMVLAAARGHDDGALHAASTSAPGSCGTAPDWNTPRPAHRPSSSSPTTSGPALRTWSARPWSSPSSPDT